MKSSRVTFQRRVSIAPGQAYRFKREHFIKPESMTVTDKNGTRHVLMQPKMESDKHWLSSEGSKVYVTVGSVVFDDRSNWKIKEE